MKPFHKASSFLLGVCLVQLISTIKSHDVNNVKNTKDNLSNPDLSDLISILESGDNSSVIRSSSSSAVPITKLSSKSFPAPVKTIRYKKVIRKIRKPKTKSTTTSALIPSTTTSPTSTSPSTSTEAEMSTITQTFKHDADPGFPNIQRREDNIETLKKIAPPSQKELVEQLSLLNTLLSTVANNATVVEKSQPQTNKLAEPAKKPVNAKTPPNSNLGSGLQTINPANMNIQQLLLHQLNLSQFDNPKPSPEELASSDDQVTQITRDIATATAVNNQISSLLSLINTLNAINPQLAQLQQNQQQSVLQDPIPQPLDEQSHGNSISDLLQQQQQLQNINLGNLLASSSSLPAQNNNGAGVFSTLGTLGSSILSSVAGIFGNVGKPSVRGVDTRLGLGYRIGDAADAQIMWDIGPQLFTETIKQEYRHAPLEKKVGTSEEVTKKALLSIKDQAEKQIQELVAAKRYLQVEVEREIKRLESSGSPDSTKLHKSFSLRDIWKKGKEKAYALHKSLTELSRQLFSPNTEDSSKHEPNMRFPGFTDADLYQMQRDKNLLKRSSKRRRRPYPKFDVVDRHDNNKDFSTLTEYEKMLLKHGTDVGFGAANNPKHLLPHRHRPVELDTPEYGESQSTSVRLRPSKVKGVFNFHLPKRRKHRPHRQRPNGHGEPIDFENNRDFDRPYNDEQYSEHASHSQHNENIWKDDAKNVRHMSEENHMNDQNRPNKNHWDDHHDNHHKGHDMPSNYQSNNGNNHHTNEGRGNGEYREKENFRGNMNENRRPPNEFKNHHHHKGNENFHHHDYRTQDVNWESHETYVKPPMNFHHQQKDNFGPNNMNNNNNEHGMDYKHPKETGGWKMPDEKPMRRPKKPMKPKRKKKAGLFNLAKIFHYYRRKTPEEKRKMKHYRRRRPNANRRHDVVAVRRDRFQNFHDSPVDLDMIDSNDHRFYARNGPGSDLLQDHPMSSFNRKKSRFRLPARKIGAPLFKLYPAEDEDYDIAPQQQSQPEFNPESNDSYLRRNAIVMNSQLRNEERKKFFSKFQADESSSDNDYQDNRKMQNQKYTTGGSSVMSFVRNYLRSSSKRNETGPTSGLGAFSRFFSGASAIPLMILPIRRRPKPTMKTKLKVVDGKLQIVNATTEKPIVHIGEDMSFEELTKVLDASKSSSSKRKKIKVLKKKRPTVKVHEESAEERIDAEEEIDNELDYNDDDDYEYDDYDDEDLKGIFIDIESGEVDVMKPVASLVSFEPKKEESPEEIDETLDEDGDGIADADMMRKQQIFSDIQKELQKNYNKMKKAHEKAEAKKRRKEELEAKGMDESIDVVSKYFDMLPDEEP